MSRVSGLGVVAFALLSGIVAQVQASDAPAVESAVAVARLRALATDAYAAMPVSADNDLAPRPNAAHAPASAADLRANLAAVLRAARIAGFAGDAEFARKWRQVAHLVDNLDLAQASPQRTLSRAPLPGRQPVAQRMVVSAMGGQGAHCSEALGLRAGHELDVALAGSGHAGSEMWLRIQPGAPGLLRLDTGASSLDTELTLFAQTCPQGDAEAVAQSDDAFGLAASVVIDTRTQPKAYFARLRNRGNAGTAFVTLDPTALITGRITDQRNGAPLWADVQAVTADGVFGASTFAGSDGNYQLATDAGSYYVYVDAFDAGYVPELYPDQPCPPASIFDWVEPCIAAGGQAVAVADGGTVSGIDVALNIGGRIAGTVRDSASGAPIAGAAVPLFKSDGTPMNEYPFSSPATTDAAGRYVIQGLLSGSYFAEATASPYGSQIWNHIDCTGPLQQSCNPLNGSPISVVRDQLTSNVDFDLPRLASIHAVVSAPVVGYPFWTLSIYDAAGGIVAYSTSINGVDAISGPLIPGSYFAVVSVDGYFPQLWNGVDCTADCVTLLAQGTLIPLALGQQAETTFALHPLPSVSGQVTDAVTHQPVADAQVILLDAQTLFVANSAFTDLTGSYEIGGLLPGNYYVWATSPTHQDWVYPTAPCEHYLFPGCDLSSAIVVAPSHDGGNVGNIDFALPANGSIGGHAQFRVPVGFPPLGAAYEGVSIFDVQGRPVSQATTLPDGSYAAWDIPAGTFYAQSNGSGFDELYDGIDCSFSQSCDPTAGTPITVGQGEQVGSIDFDILPSDVIFGRVTDAGGQGVANVAIDSWATQTQEHVDVGVTDADGYYTVHNAYNLYFGNTYLLSTDVGGLAYDDQAYDGIACPMGPVYLGLCSLADATPVGAPAVPGFVIANFSLRAGTGTLFRDGFDP
ncbi:MAG TPA: carboxypeptidase regulatory-like domain-containing protein [Dokdonella sp.]